MATYQHTHDISRQTTSPASRVVQAKAGESQRVRFPMGAGISSTARVPVGIQTKLTLNQPGDFYEQQADRVADKVMRMSDAQIQRKCAECEEADSGSGQVMRKESALEEEEPGLMREAMPEEEEPALMRKEANAGTSSAEAPEIVHDVVNGVGNPLDSDTRSFMEPRFGHDFSNVRLHTGSRAAESAQAVNARAYTVGNNVVFNSGEYSPGTSDGRQLLAHELTHVVQQGGNQAALQRALQCDIQHVVDECNGAATSCMTVQSDFCAKKYPGTKEINDLHASAVLGAQKKKTDLPHAAENLLHFLSGSGKEKVMPVAIFKNDSATKSQLEVHRAKFIKGAVRRLGDGELTVGGSVDMVWTDTASAFSIFDETDLGLAVGGYTLCSKVTTSARDKGNGRTVLHFDKWSVQAFDCYNWDPSKSINFFGGVKDAQLCCLQNAGKGKHFRIRTDPWTNDYSPSIADATI